MSAIYYRVLEHCEETYHSIEWHYADPFGCPHSRRGIAEKCAEDCWRRYDGWEQNWPLTFALHNTETGPELARFVVELEVEPSFSASPVEETSLALDAPPDAQTP